MPPDVDHALPLVSHAKLGLGYTPAGPENVLIVVGAYVLVLLVLVIFGVLGWQGQKPGGNGGGGGGPKRPPGQDLPPPSGRELRADDPPPGVVTDDFAAWERQMESADRPDEREDVPAGEPARR
jgi:hypothetical protein